MQSTDRFGGLLGVAALLCTFVLCGCGMPGEPQPPSLELPVPVSDLSVLRTGDVVTLAWTMPKNDTSKLSLKANEAVAVRICRAEGAGACGTVGELNLLPGAKGSFTETLTGAVAGGAPRALRYSVELMNRRGRSAGMSNAATVLAGQAPAAVVGLTAEVRRDGVAVRWTAEPVETQVRLMRKRVTPQAAAKPKQGPLAPASEPAEESLLVPPGGVRGAALDKGIRFGESYEYRAQRIARLTVEGKELELDGPLSPAVRVDVVNVFAPAVPEGLAAVATPGANGAAPSIDLIWQPDSESYLSGYAVYRREGSGEWQRVSPAQPVVGPGFHDATVRAGHSYEYAVTALGDNDRESARSSAAQETVPEP